VAIGADPDPSAALRLGHVVEAQKIDVAVARQAGGFELMERIGKINQTRWLPLIERIFDEFDRPGDVIRIDRIDLDLGRVEPDALEDLDARLTEALRGALRKAVGDAAQEGTGSVETPRNALTTIRNLDAALVDMFEHYLLRGAWPYGSGLDPGTRPADLFARLLEEAPAALVRRLRRHGGSDTVVRRLVRQMPAALLERLLHRLAPENARWVLGYMSDVREAQRVEPVVDAAPEALAEMLWQIVLRDALHRAGLRANRRAFVAGLVDDVAAAAGLPRTQLLAQLHAALAATPAAALREDSLLSILAEIAGAAGAIPAPRALPPHLGGIEAALAALLPKAAQAVRAEALAMPASTAPELFVHRLLEAAGPDAAGGLEALHARAVAAGGEARRVLAPLLADALRPDPRPLEAVARREAALEALRQALGGAPRGWASAPDAVAAALPRLTGMAPEVLRESLGGPGLRTRDAAAGLRRLDVRSLRRLIALLAPRGQSRETLRLRLASVDRDALALMAASLLTGHDLPEPSVAALPANHRLDRAEEAALQTVAGAVASSHQPDAQGRRAFALLLRRRPAALLRLLVAAQTNGPWTRLLADPTVVGAFAASLPERARREVEAMARVLTGPAGRRAIPAEIVARAFLVAARAAVHRGSGGEDFALLWSEALVRSATAAQRRSLSNLLPATATAAAGETAAASRTDAEPEPGSAVWLIALAEDSSAAARRRLRAALRSQALRRQAARGLPSDLLVRLLAAAFPDEARALLAAREAFAAAGHARRALWEALLAAGSAAPRGGAVGRLLDRLVPLGSARSDDEERLVAFIARRGGSAHAPLSAAIERRRALRGGGTLQASGGESAKPARKALRPAATDAGEEPIVVANAGLVLAGPYLPQLFDRLGLMHRDEAGKLGWRSIREAERGVHLVQYLVDGRGDAPEPMLPLNKVLCGLDPSWPTGGRSEMTDEEREICDSLLRAIIANWPMLSGSSVAALRETFLQREGRLTRTDQGWKLDVERKVLDVLLESVPWSYSMILHPWMPAPMSVAW
jgi:hypothetical protein